MPAVVDETPAPEHARDLECLFRAHYVGLLRLAAVLTGDAALAEDLTQEAFVRLGRQRRWPDSGGELPYLRRTIVNLSHGHFRRRAIARRKDVAERDDSGDLTGPAGVARARQQTIAEAVRRLPHRQRECVVLRYYADLSDTAIALALGISSGSVKSSLSRARSALAKQLEDLR
jgi:RNA polymerase sigma-70 factor (ECF subfamily)